MPDPADQIDHQDSLTICRYNGYVTADTDVDRSSSISHGCDFAQVVCIVRCDCQNISDWRIISRTRHFVSFVILLVCSSSKPKGPDRQ